VITVDQHTMIVSDAASGLGLTRADLWSAVTEAGAKATQVALTEQLHARLYPVSPGRVGDGVVMVIGAGVPRGLTPPMRTPLPKLTPLEYAERQVIIDTLADCRGNKKETALRLGLSRGTLYDRLRRYRIDDAVGS
jgi:transcriptional regulator of acetoin/glycerol metabolism